MQLSSPFDSIKTVLLTGGLGFIGHHIVEHFIRNTEWKIIILDKLSYACKGFERLKSSGLLYNERIKIFTWDLVTELSDGIIKEIGQIDCIFHLAADTHVDNSIASPVEFMMNNIKSTITMLEYARKLKSLKFFLYFSTDEVYGNANKGNSYKESDRHRPTNPYSASKSASEQLCYGYWNTYDIPLIVVNSMNVYGERQMIEKYCPKLIKMILNGETVNIHTDKLLKPGSRFYIHARNVADAVLFIIKNGKIGENYNITGEKEIDNLEFAQLVSSYVGKPLKFLLDPAPAERKGHDLRYALDGTKLKELGWEPPKSFEESLKKTVEWTLKHKEWLDW